MKKETNTRGAWATMILSGLCGVLWLYIALFRREDNRLLSLAVAVAWLILCAVWGLRIWRARKNKEDEP